MSDAAANLKQQLQESWMSGEDWKTILATITWNNQDETNIMIFEWVVYACKIIPIPLIPSVGWGMEAYTAILHIIKAIQRTDIYDFLLNRNNYQTDEEYMQIAKAYHASLDTTRLYDSFAGIGWASILTLPADIFFALISLIPFLYWVPIQIGTNLTGLVWL